MIETSPALTRLQQQKLEQFSNISWGTSLAVLKNKNVPVILVANELLDAFPVHQFEVGDGVWKERGFDANLAPATRPAGVRCPVRGARGSTVVETSPGRLAWLEEMKTYTRAALLVDYGYTEGEGDSVQALHRHQPVPLIHLPGESDITAHVNFAQVAGTLGAACRLSDLAPFLLKYGLLYAAEPDIDNPQTAAALHRLLHPTRMGALFKVAEYLPE